jgi:hypothetical protein
MAVPRITVCAQKAINITIKPFRAEKEITKQTFSKRAEQQATYSLPSVSEQDER